MGVLVFLHRWLGVIVCLPVAMWFATGIVMHFVPFPAPQEVDGSGALDFARVRHGPAEAIAAGVVSGTTRVRLIGRSDGPIYLIIGPSSTKAVRADDLADGAIRSNEAALAIARDHARRHANFSPAANAGLARYDQWTLSSAYDRHRPLYRIALDDEASTELYVSSASGEVVLTTTGRVRAWNYAGSVLHWIYFTGLRSHPAAWSALLWWLSLLALLAVALGAILGPLRMTVERGRLASPFRGWQAWHHWLGLACMPFLITWIFSGWLSMDDGLLFSSGRPAPGEAAALVGEAAWDALPADEMRRVEAPVSEVTWFAFDGRIHRREHDAGGQPQEFLSAADIDVAARRLTAPCEPAFRVATDDSYAPAAAMRDRPVYRLVCASDWFHIDATDGALLEKLDPSRRRYRWLYDGLHKLDFPLLRERPALRTILIVVLCACGLIFSMTAVVIGWRRLTQSSS